jgi:hypothetical protein
LYDPQDLAADSRGNFVTGERPNLLSDAPGLFAFYGVSGQSRGFGKVPFNIGDNRAWEVDLSFDQADRFTAALNYCHYFYEWRCLDRYDYRDLQIYKARAGYDGVMRDEFDYEFEARFDAILPPYDRLRVTKKIVFSRASQVAPTGTAFILEELKPFSTEPPTRFSIRRMDNGLQAQVVEMDGRATDMAFDSITDQLFVSTTDSVYRIDAPFTQLSAPKKIVDGFIRIAGIAFDERGNLWVIDDRAQPSLECSKDESCGLGTLWKIERGEGYYIRIYLSETPTGIYEDGAVDPGGQRDLEIPFGSPFVVRYRYKDPVTKQEKDVATVAKITSKTVETTNQLGLKLVSLFPYDSVIKFDDPLPDNSHGFIAVHRGTATIELQPNIPNTRPLKILVKVSANIKGSMGPHDELDVELSDLGHHRGIPAHFLKGTIQSESYPKWNQYTYRYEPLTVDYLLLSGTAKISNVSNPLHHLKDSRYVDFAFPNGSKIVQDDRFMRADRRTSLGYMNVKDPVTSAIRPATDSATDDTLTAFNYFMNSDGFGIVPGAKWSQKGRGSRLIAAEAKNNPNVLQFVAQTSIAASYGFMQILWVTAIDQGWKGVTPNGDKNPYFLLDTPSNIARGGGSLTLGTYKLAADYRDVNGKNFSDHPTFANYGDFVTKYKMALGIYNASPKYPGDIMNAVPPFVPTASTVFP